MRSIPAFALSVLVVACADPKCGDELRYDRESDLCVCPNGGRYQPGDGGRYCFLPDGSVTPLGDGGPCELADAGTDTPRDAGTETPRDAGADAPLADACEPRTLHRDADGDGFGDAAESMEACGEVAGWVEDATDCDDACETCFPGAAETCNGRDDDCDLVEDEGLVTSTYYVDCDGDGYAPAGASPVMGCAPPDRAPDGCASGGWTTRAPTTGATDCADHEARAFPGQTEWFETAIPGAPAAADFDYDCDGVETKRWTVAGFVGCRVAPAGCVQEEGWSPPIGSPGVPECGVSERYFVCASGCVNDFSTRVQPCR